MNSQIHIIETMNTMAVKGIPFLFIIDFECKNPDIIPLNNLDNDRILYKFRDKKNYIEENSKHRNFYLKKYPISYSKYKEAFDIVNENQINGNSYLLNLTFPTKIECSQSLLELFHLSRAKYKLYYKDEFIFFSPETFVTIKDNIISAYPMKGTIDAEIEDAENIILADEKEFAEHLTIVDLMRNDLNRVAENIHVEKFRYIDRISTHEGELLQVSSKINGELENNYQKRFGDIIFSLLPAGSISGAPKIKTVNIIKNSEKYCRGYYTGVCGIFDGMNLDSAVMIRFIEKSGSTYWYKSGGGITVYSDPESEYKELIDKVYVPIA